MPESASEEISRRLSTYPEQALPYLKHGFAAVARLSDEARRLVLAEMISNFQRGTRRLDSSALKEITGLSQRSSEQIASVYSLIIGLLSESSASPEEFVEASKGVIFFPEQEAAARKVVGEVCDSRTEIQRTVAKTQLAGEVLPSLFTFDAVVDLRVRIEDGKVATSTPVAVLHIDTDADNHEMWVQLTKGDIESILKTLNKCLVDMRVAETLVALKS